MSIPENGLRAIASDLLRQSFPGGASIRAFHWRLTARTFDQLSRLQCESYTVAEIIIFIPTYRPDQRVHNF